MSLPSIDRLVAASPKALREIGRALAALGLGLAAAEPFVTAAARLPNALRPPVRAHHLRKQQGPVAMAMRALMFADPITADEAHSAFRGHLDAMIDLGLLAAREDGSIVSPFVLAIVDDLYVLADDLTRGGDAVMGLGASTIELCRAAFPRERVGRALDVGTGAGTLALVLAKQAREVVGVDVSPRAVALARVNAALNGVTNASFREGDLLAPVADEAFDLVVAQPPFVPRPASAGAATFLDGGARGDELALRLFSGLDGALAPRGRALARVDWLELPGDAIEARLERSLAPGLGALVLAADRATIEEHAAEYAAGIDPTLGATYRAEVDRRLDHVVALGAEGLRPTIVVVTRVPGAKVERVLVEGPRFDVSSARVDRLLAARALGAAGDEALAAARLRMPEGVVLAQEQDAPGADAGARLVARLPSRALGGVAPLGPEELFLFTRVHQATSVRRGVERFCEDAGLDRAAERARLFALVRDALARGVLELA
jgi:SAM-dependent methyltransferase